MTRGAWRQNWEDREWFPNWPAQVPMIGFFSVGALLEWPSAFLSWGSSDQSGSRGFAVAIVVMCIGGACRSLVAPSIEVNPRNLVLRSLLRTQTLAWPSVAGVAVETGATGMLPVRRQFLVIELGNGETRSFTGLNVPYRRGQMTDPRLGDPLKSIRRQIRLHGAEQN